MPSISGWTLQMCEVLPEHHGHARVSMPSISGWTLQGTSSSKEGVQQVRGFYALDIGLDFARGDTYIIAYNSSEGFLCPRYRAGLCKATSPGRHHPGQTGFYALDIGLDFASFNWTRMVRTTVSMPSISGWTLQASGGGITSAGVAVSMPSISGWTLQGPSTQSANLVTFLCPRYRAGLCKRHGTAGYAHLPHVSMPSISGWTLQGGGLPAVARQHRQVSMPSISGWTLQELTGRPAAGPGTGVSMPSISGWTLQARRFRPSSASSTSCFYALDIGLDFARGNCLACIDRQDVSMPSISGWTLQG